MTELAITEPFNDHLQHFISWMLRRKVAKEKNEQLIKDERMHKEDRAKSGKMLSEVTEAVYTLYVDAPFSDLYWRTTAKALV